MTVHETRCLVALTARLGLAAMRRAISSATNTIVQLADPRRVWLHMLMIPSPVRHEAKTFLLAALGRTYSRDVSIVPFLGSQPDKEQ
jgi:hypothetical protein